MFHVKHRQRMQGLNGLDSLVCHTLHPFNPLTDPLNPSGEALPSTLSLRTKCRTSPLTVLPCIV